MTGVLAIKLLLPRLFSTASVLTYYKAALFADSCPMPAEKEPGLSMPEYSKKLGEMWRELSDAEKKPYHVSKMCLTAARTFCTDS
jgi:hypothetical protein